MIIISFHFIVATSEKEKKRRNGWIEKKRLEFKNFFFGGILESVPSSKKSNEWYTMLETEWRNELERECLCMCVCVCVHVYVTGPCMVKIKSESGC